MNKDEYTISEKMISVSDIHQLYTQLWGNKSSKKVYVFLHGGPGSGVNDGNKVLFNPKKDLVLFFDQRGAGKSMPRGSLVDNNTDELIKDIDKITNEYKLDKFILVGGSWGSCLALAYAIKKPARVAGMIVRGIFTGRQSEIDFLDNGEFKSFYPDVWDQ